MLVPETILFFSVSDLDNKEIVAKKVERFPHRMCEKGNILSQVEAIFFLYAVLSCPPFLNASIFPKRETQRCLFTVTVELKNRCLDCNSF